MNKQKNNANNAKNKAQRGHNEGVFDETNMCPFRQLLPEVTVGACVGAVVGSIVGIK